MRKKKETKDANRSKRETYMKEKKGKSKKKQ